MAFTVNMHEAKTKLSKLVASALAGEEVIITRAGKPVARLTPVRERRKLGLDRGRIWMSPDFDALLPEEALREFEGR